MMLPMKLVTHTSFEVLAQTALRKLKGGGRAISTADHAPPSQWSAARVPTAQASSSERLQTPWRLLLPAGVGLRDHPFPSQWRTSIPCASKAPSPNMVAAVTGECLNGMVRSAFHGQPLGSVPMKQHTCLPSDPDVACAVAPNRPEESADSACYRRPTRSVPMREGAGSSR